MLPAPALENEAERLADLHALRVLDTPAEQRFDRIVELARRSLNLPIAFISLVDSDRQWFKSRCGLGVASTPRDISFCGHAIQQEEPTIVPDSHLDPRFADNPLVRGEPFVRFYAGFPLKGARGYNVGTLCVVDHQPRNLSQNELAILRQLAAMAENELNLVEVIDMQRQLLESKNQLVAAQQKLAAELNDAAQYVRSLLPPPMQLPIETDYLYISSSQLGGDLLGYHALDEHRIALYLYDVTGHGVSAALLSTTVYQTLRWQTLPNVRFDRPEEVLAGLNRAFPMEANDGRFLTIWYGVLNHSTGELLYANGGHPSPILFESNTAPPLRLDGNDLIIGIMPGSEYQAHRRVLAPGNRIFVFSDGVFEVRSPDRSMLSFGGFVQLLAETIRIKGRGVRDVLQAVRKYQAADSFVDDFSILEVRLPPR